MTRITKTVVDGLDPPATGQKLIWDSEMKGFGIRVVPGGRKTYIVQGRVAGRTVRKTIGPHGVFTADQARGEARQLLAQMARDEDPRTVTKAEHAAISMRDLAQDYLEKHARPRKADKSVENDVYMLRTKILPALGSKRVSDVGVQDVQALMASMSETPYSANRVRSLLSKMFALAVDWGQRSDNPALKVKKYKEHKRTRWLSQEEITRLLDALQGIAHRPAADALRFLLLTGARKGEVLKAEWTHFNLDRKEWRKPIQNTKQRQEEIVPLSDLAVDLLSQIRASSTEPFVFPGSRKGTRLHDLKIQWQQVRDAANLPGVRIHDLRHTFASHLASSGQSLLVIGKLLGHSQAQTTARYAHLANEPLRYAANQFGSIFSQSGSAGHERDVKQD